MRTRKQIENEAKDMVSKMSMAGLVEAFELTDKSIDGAVDDEYIAIATSRGWIMDELEKRDGEAFLNWLDSPAGTSPLEYFIK